MAKEVAGLKIPETYDCAGKSLPLQGAGLRTATWLKIKVYVLAYYAAEKKAPSMPSCFNLTYLRDFDNSDVDKAWSFQFRDSSMHPYPQLEEHVKEIQKYFGEIKGDRSENFVLEEGTTKVFENGVLKGEIKGPEFQKNFLSLWFGEKPPTPELQKELLK
jgi:hypothetical protein